LERQSLENTKGRKKEKRIRDAGEIDSDSVGVSPRMHFPFEKQSLGNRKNTKGRGYLSLFW
jgi:hypothetical protein